MKKILLILLLTYSFSMKAWSQANYPFFYDKDRSIEFGASNSLVIHKAISSFQDSYIPNQLWNEDRVVGKSLGFGYRMAKLFLLDFQEDFLFALVQHEVFGHGARYREFGAENNIYSLNMFFPFGNGSGSAFPGSNISLAGDKGISATIGGVEANQVLANTLTNQILLGDQMHYRQGLLYLVSKNNLSQYIWRDRFSSSPGDIAGYVRALNSRYGTPEKTYSIEKLSMQSLVSLLNPIQLYSTFGILYQYGFKGEEKLSNIPMIKLGSIDYMPALGLNLTPFGSEYFLSNNIRWKNRLVVLEMGISDGFFNQFYRVSAKGFNLVNLPSLRMNFQMDFWNQPELSLTTWSGPAENQFGTSLATDIMFNPFPEVSQMGLYLQMGYKTKGFQPGLPLDRGPLLKIGLNLSFNKVES